MRLRVQDRGGRVGRVQDSGRGPAARTSSTAVAEPRELLLRRDVVLLGPREMRPQTLDLEPRVLRPGARTPPRPPAATRRPGASRCRPSRARAPDPRAAAARRSRPPPEYRVGVSRWASATASEPGGSSERTRIGASMPAARRRRPSSTSATPSPRGAGLDRGPRHLHVAVAVAVRLHDRHQLGAVGFEDAGVVADRVEVDVDPGGSEPLGHPPSTCATASGMRSSTSPATRPSPRSRPASIPASPWRYARGRGGLRRRDPSGEQPADHAGQHVARAGRREDRRPGHVDEQPPVRLGDHRPAALQERDGVRLGRRAPHVRGTIRVEVARLHAGEPRELADVRREHRLGLAVAEGGSVACERVQPVGIEHEGDGRARGRARGRTPPSASSVVRPGPIASASARREPFQHGSARPRVATVPSSVSGSGRNVASVSPAWIAGIAPSGAATVTVRRRPCPRPRRSAGRAGHAARPGHDDEDPRRALVRVGIAPTGATRPRPRAR